MAVTVADVLAMPALRQGAPEGLSDRRMHEPIRWLHVAEVADMSTLLQGGELVLTIGTGLKADPRRFLRGIADAGALGVIVELGWAVSAVPAAAVAEARRLDLALVALHRPIRFVDVTEAVHRRIVAEQFDEVAFDRRLHETFTELSMKRASAEAIVDAAADMLGAPVVLEDLAHQALVVSVRGPAAATVLRDWERRSRLCTDPDGGPEGWVATAVGPRGEQWGRLIVPEQPADRDRAVRVLERAATALALHRMMERARSGLYQRAQSGLIEDVLRGRITDEREVAARAHALGLRPADRYVPAVVRVHTDAAAGDPVQAQRHTLGLVDAVAHTVRAAGHTGLFSIRGDTEVALLLALNRRYHHEDRALAALGDRLAAAVQRLDGVAAAVLAVADSTAELTDAIHALGEAAHVAEVAIASRDRPRPFYRAADVRLRGLIALLRDDPRVQRFAETELRTLLRAAPDGADPSDLEVLRQYLRLGGNKAALAARLHLSRPALYKRLAAIAERIGVDLDDAESATSLHVALMILEARRGVGVRG